MKKRILLFVALFIMPFIVYAKGDVVHSFDMDIYIDDNGNAHITETWVADANMGSEFYRTYYNIGESTITDFSVSMDGKEYTYINNWDVSLSLSDKAYKNGININENGGYELCFGKTSLGSHTYISKYTITNFVIQLNDSQMIDWTLLPYDNGGMFRQIHIKIYSDHIFENTMDVWGFGNYGGTCYVANGYIEMNLDRTLNDSEYMTILAKIPNNTFNLSVISNNDFNTYLERAKNGSSSYEKKEDKFEKFILNISNTALIVTLVISTCYFVYIFIKYDKEYENEFNARYLREFPSSHSPAVVEYLLKHAISGNAFSTSIVNMVYKKGLLLEEITTSENGLFKKKNTKDYLFKKNDIDLKKELSAEEVYLRDSLINKFGSGDSFCLSDIKNASKSEISSRRLVNIYNSWTRIAKKEAIKEHFYEDIPSRGLLFIFPILLFIISFIFISASSFQGIIMLAISMILIIYVGVVRRKTKEGLELFYKWNALKNFLSDFGTFKDKELPEISLWEKYLVYANIFGIAEKLEKEMKVKIPELYDNNLNAFDYIYINSALNRTISREISNSLSSAHAHMAESYSGGGGGFSSGGGGGGSFGGGGGGAGGR